MRVLHGFMKAFAIILCVVLFFTCLAAAILSVAVDLVKVDTLRRIATEVDWFSLMDSSEDDDPYSDAYMAAVPRGLLSAGARLSLPAAAMDNGIDLSPDSEVGGILDEELLGGLDMEALESIIQTEEMETFFAYMEDYGESIELDGDLLTAAMQADSVQSTVRELANEFITLLMTEDRSTYDVKRLTRVVDKHAEDIRKDVGFPLEDRFFELGTLALESLAVEAAASEALPPADQIMDIVVSGALESMGTEELAQINALLGLSADATAAETVAALHALLNTVTTVLWISAVLLVGLIALLWWHLYRWSLPVGITVLLAGATVLSVGVLGGLLINTVIDLTDTTAVIAAQLADTALLSRFTLYGGIMAGVGILCIAAYIVLRIVLRKKPEVQPAAETPVFKDAVKA